MSDENKPKHWWDFPLERAKIWITNGIFIGLTALFVMIATPVKDKILLIWRGPDRLLTIETKIDTLSEQIKIATGENRVIYEMPGLSYVREPVYFGDKITLNMVVKRTKLGESCRLLNRTPIFTDENNVAIGGKTEPPAVQIDNNERPVKIELDIPKQIEVGRVTVYLSLQFQCGDNQVFDKTRPVAFNLLEAQK